MKIEREINTYPEDTSTSNSTFNIINLKTRFVDIKRPNHYHIWRGHEVPLRDWDLLDNVLAHNIDVVFQLC